MLNRRQLFKGLAGAVVAAPLVAKAAAEGFDTSTMVYRCRELAPPASYFTSNTSWFLKPEHQDGVALFSHSHPPAPSSMREILEPGIRKFWGEAFSAHSREWAALFGPEQLTLF